MYVGLLRNVGECTCLVSGFEDPESELGQLLLQVVEVFQKMSKVEV